MTLHNGPSNGLSAAFGLLSDEWTLLLIRTALTGSSKYSEFLQRIPISNAVLSNRLELLVSEKIFEKQAYQDNPTRFKYLLTEQGKAIWPLTIAIWGWERRWVSEHVYATPPLIHLNCGHEMSPQYCCAECGEKTQHSELQVVWGPAGGWQRSTPTVSTRKRRASNNSKAEAYYPETMALLGNRWSSIIVAAALTGISRFRDFEKHLGPPANVLTERLSELCTLNIMEQVQLPERPDWSEYQLTEKGISTFPILAILVDWAEKWRPDAEGKVMLRTHNKCNKPFTGILKCDHCHQKLSGDSIDISHV